MADTTIKKMWRGFLNSGMLMRIIWVNVAVFVILRVINIVCMFCADYTVFNVAMSIVQVPSSFHGVLTHPWTLVTYMFSQYDLWHIVFNMLWLYWFGSLFAMVATPRQTLLLYILGGLAGAMLYVLAYAFMPVFAGYNALLIGSSASVIAIVTATAIMMPDFRMNLLFIGSMSLKWIAIASIVLVLIGITGSNAGGEIAHVGGVITGVIYGLSMRRGHDITKPLARFFDSVSNGWNRIATSASTFSWKRKARTFRAEEGPANYAKSSDGQPHISREDAQKLDAVLDKLKRSGYAGLSAEEKRILFEMSRKIK